MDKYILFKLHLKKTFKIYPTIFLVTLLTLVAIGVSAFFVFQSDSSGEDKQKLSVGIVGDLDDTYFGIGINVLQNIDVSRYSVDFKQMTYEDATKSLKAGKIEGFLYIPRDFAENIYYGINTPAKYYILDGPEGLGTTLSQEVFNIISNIVVETQNGCISFRKLANELNIKKNISKTVNNMNYKYIEFILNRNGTYEVEHLGIKNHMTFKGYFLCGIIMFFLLIWGVSCNKLLSSGNLELSRMLKSSGVRTYKQILYEYVPFLIITILTLFFFAIVVGIVTLKNKFGIGELLDSNLFTCLLFVVKILPVIIMITTMHTMLSELIPGAVSKILAQLLIAIGLGYVSGCFYPNFFFPEEIQFVSGLLPSGCGLTYIQNAMSGNLSVIDFLSTILYTLIFFGITVFSRNRALKEAT